MLVLNERLPYSRSALWGGFAFLLALAIFVGRESPEAVAQAKATPDAEAVGSTFEGIHREAMVGEEITGNRAYLYAPPPMPHERSDVSQGECLNCHAPETNLPKRWRAIRPLAHPVYSQCLQCHVAQERGAIELFAANEFVGLDYPGEGSQAHEYAPPTVPHKVFMRENCLSCHGNTGYADFRTSHPERSQCLQCHVPEASADYTRPIE